MEFMDQYSKTVIDILRSDIKKNHPEKLHKFQEDLAWEMMDFDEDDGSLARLFDERFACSSLTRRWGEEHFGLCGYGIHVEVAKQHPELKEQAKKILEYEMEGDAGDWDRRNVIHFKDDFNVKDGVSHLVQAYDQLKEWENYFGTKFNLHGLNKAVADYISMSTALQLPRDEDIIRQLPKEVFDNICNLREYEPESEEEHEIER